MSGFYFPDSLSFHTNFTIALNFTITVVPTSPRTSLTASKGGPRKLGPTSGVGQCLARHVSQGAKEWSDVDHQDVLMCPRQQSEDDVTSGIGDLNNKAGP